MKNVSKLSVLFFLFLSLNLFGQTSSEKLRNEENRLAKKNCYDEKIIRQNKNHYIRIVQ